MQRSVIGTYQIMGGRKYQQDALSYGEVHAFDRLSVEEQERVVLQTYQQCEQQIEQNDYPGGSTAVSVIAWIKKRGDERILSFHSASLGDARGFLLVLTAKHEIKYLQRVNPKLHSILTENRYLNLLEEIATNKRGGRFSNGDPDSDDCMRLCDVFGQGSLNITGAFNDLYVPGLSHVPYLDRYQFTISASDTVYLFAASDGLTDELTDLSRPQDIGINRFIEGIKKGEQLSVIAQSMVMMAEKRVMELGYESDNISLVIGQVIEDQPPLFVAAYDGHGDGGEVVSSFLAKQMLRCLRGVLASYFKKRNELLLSVLDNKDTQHAPASQWYRLIPPPYKVKQSWWALAAFQTFNEEKKQAQGQDRQKNYWLFMDTCLLMKAESSKRGMQRVLLETMVHECKTVFEMNCLYVQLKQLPELNAHRYLSADRFLQRENTRSWQQCLLQIRVLAKERLQKEQEALPADDRIAYLQRAREMPIFSDHRGNWFTSWGSGCTQAVKDIDLLLTETQQRLRL